MQDRFKYRVWDPFNKKMIYYHELSLCLPALDRPEEFQFPELFSWEVLKFPRDENYKKLNAKQLDECVLMQCTGIKDCVNNDIYEGDLLKIKKNNALIGEGLVIYKQSLSTFCIKLKNKKYKGKKDTFYTLAFNFFEFESIGNNYDKQ